MCEWQGITDCDKDCTLKNAKPPIPVFDAACFRCTRDQLCDAAEVIKELRASNKQLHRLRGGQGMKINITEHRAIQFEEVFNPIELLCESGENMSVCMRDGAFEITVSNSKTGASKWYVVSSRGVDPRGQFQVDKPDSGEVGRTNEEQ